jgi:hypothetical protein
VVVRRPGAGFSLGNLTVVVVAGKTSAVAIELLTRQERRLKPELQHPGWSEIGDEVESGRDVAAARRASCFRVPRRVLLSLDYAAQSPIYKWQSATNGPFRTELWLISSRFGISFQFLRASVQAP